MPSTWAALIKQTYLEKRMSITDVKIEYKLAYSVGYNMGLHLIQGNIPEDELFIPEEFKNELSLFWEGFRLGFYNGAWGM